MPNTQNLYIHTLLVRPQYAKNIGQAIRATANCGFGSVHVIDPECEMSNEMRKWAAGAQDSVKQLQTYSSWEDFNQKNSDSFRLGLTRRTGKHRKLYPFDEGLELCFDSPTFNKKLFLVFGPEDDGLNTEDLNHVNMCCSLSLYGDFKSLNLSHAVLLSQHTSHRIFLNRKVKSQKTESEDTMSFPDEALMAWLKSSGVQKSKTKLNTFEVLKKTILRAFPSQKELSTFEKAFRASINATDPKEKN